MTVRELLASTDSRELAEWQAYEQVAGPVGPGRADLNSAVMSATVANSSGNAKKSYTPEDFMPDWDGRRKKSVTEQVSSMKNWALAKGKERG